MTSKEDREYVAARRRVLDWFRERVALGLEPVTRGPVTAAGSWGNQSARDARERRERRAS